jgi:hypothetical protein
MWVLLITHKITLTFFVMTAIQGILPVTKTLILLVKVAQQDGTKTKTAPLFVCPATLDCINRKRGNQAAQNARKTITPTNPNKPHAKRVWARKKRRIQVPPFVSNVRQGNSCPPTKHVYFAN